MEYIPYTSKQGDRWDSIAYDAYGDEKYMKEIADANIEIALDVPIPAGTLLRIPVLDIVQINKELLPPWLR
jgi:phage tail protein X